MHNSVNFWIENRSSTEIWNFSSFFSQFSIPSWSGKVTSRAENPSAQAMAGASLAWAHHYCPCPINQYLSQLHKTVLQHFNFLHFFQAITTGEGTFKTTVNFPQLLTLTPLVLAVFTTISLQIWPVFDLSLHKNTDILNSTRS